MRKVDRLIERARKIDRQTIPPVHIIEGGYCYSCKGECKYEDKCQRKELGEDIVIIYDDIPNNTNGFADAPTETLIKIVESENI